jgi:hypothetical protein
VERACIGRDIVGRDSAHNIALTLPAKITTNFRPNFKHESGNFFYHYDSEGRVFLRSVNAARISKSSNVRNRP